MRSRALQVFILIALGVTLGLLITRGWQPAAPTAASAPEPEPPPALTVTEPPAATEPKTADADAPRSPPAREFKLPAMSAAAPEPELVAVSNNEPAPAKPPAATVRVPRSWLLRGTAPEHYDLSSDRDRVKSGEASVMIKSHLKSIPLSLNGSVMQSVLADALLGRRLEVSAFLRAEEVRERTVALWCTVTDSNNLLLATDSSRQQFPKITADWTRVSFVIEVPWSAAQVSYGLSLTGIGSAWMDDFRLTTVDSKVVALTTTTLPRQFGQPVESASSQALARPENLDFEEITDVPAPSREKPSNAVTGIRQ